MPTRLRLTGGRWWRFSQYQIVDGFIRPARGAELEEYSPWDAYEELSLRQKEGKPRPYQSLFAVLDPLEKHRPADDRRAFATVWPLTRDRRRRREGQPPLRSWIEEHLPEEVAEELKVAICAWCSQFGLLGLLVHRTWMVVLPPGRSSEGRTYRRSGTGWHQIRAASVDRDLPEGVLLQERLSNSTLTFRGLDALKDYFPSRHRRVGLSLSPLSEGRFWRGYQEPLDEFVDAVVLLRDALRFLALDADALLAGEPESIPVKLGRRRFEKGLDLLNGIVESTSPGLRLETDGSLRYKWLAPSLLAALAMMALQDLSSGGQVRVCQVCNAPFVSSKRALSGLLDIRYCSVNHRRRAQQRAYRQRERQRDK